MQKLKQIIDYLIYLLIFLLPLQTRWIYHEGILNGEPWEYGAFSLYATEILFGVILILSIIHLIGTWKSKFSKPDKRRIFRVSILIIFILFFILNAFFAINSSIAIYKFVQLILATAFFIIILISRLDLKKISWAIALSALYQSIVAIQQFIGQKVIANKWLGMSAQDPATLGVPVIESAGIRTLRSFGTMPHPNILAGFLLISLIVIIGLYAMTKISKRKKLLQLLFTINFIGLLTAFSRSALLAFAVVTIFMAFYFSKDKIMSRATTKFIIIAIFIFILFSVSFPNLMAARAFGEGRLEVQSNASRLEQYNEFAKIFSNRWLIGVGLENYSLAVNEINPNQPAWNYQPIHNVYLLIITELGIAGIAILGLLGFMIFKLIKLQKNKNYYLPCLVALGFLALFDHYLWSFYFGIMFCALILGLALTEQSGKK
ncbi:O-antigen ligase family protein [Patescibacteria group bacterium]|nr:O-antigen ligase family protein [Patescibacteria group bacterium]